MFGDGFGQRLLIAEIDEDGFDARGFEHLHQHVDGRAVKSARGQNDAPAIEQRRQNRDMQGGHARAAGERAGARFEPALERGYEFLQRFVRRIAVTGIAGPRHFIREHAVEIGRVLVEITRRSVDGRGHRHPLLAALGAGPFAVAGVDGACIEFHLRFQRMPSFVSSRMMFFSRSCARIWSARAKSRAFLAAVRSAMRVSISCV